VIHERHPLVGKIELSTGRVVLDDPWLAGLPNRCNVTLKIHLPGSCSDRLYIFCHAPVSKQRHVFDRLSDDGAVVKD
jgi:hypothetical protein